MNWIVSAVPAEELLKMLTPEEARGAQSFVYLGHEVVVNRYDNLGRLSWGHQIGGPNIISACGPYLTRWGAKRDAKRFIREELSKKKIKVFPKGVKL